MLFSYSPVQSLSTFDEMIRQAKLAESLGFHGLWTHEHHSEGSMYPSPLLTCSILAGATERITVGTNMLLLPLYHPLRVAEEGAMVDAQSGGRLRLGVSAGYSKIDLRAFHANPLDRGHVMEDSLKLIREVWTQDNVNLEERFSDLTDYTLNPKPVQKPSPPIYAGATVDKAIRRAARLADELVISATQSVNDVPRVLDVYNSELLNLGKNPAEKHTTINRLTCVVDKPSEKELALAHYGKIFLSLYMKWGHTNITTLDIKSRELEELCRDHLLIGEPDECVEMIGKYREAGIGEIACLMNFGNPDLVVVDKSMKLFAEKVMPQFC
jgi:alkanesulfonate monooxygenase SsuD/methylene tetrahydromethanopterin reductase-like flavin-dependent oxidoreductase (luciferase family)